jgi:hypothetical protein
MSLKDKLEIGLKPDAPYRAANLPGRELAGAKLRKRKSSDVARKRKPARVNTRRAR